MSDKKIRLDMVTPERVALETTAEFVVLPAVNGEMGVLPGHAPFMVQLAPGEIRVTEGGGVRHYAVSGGFAEVLDDKVSVFAETAEMAQEIDTERARQALERAKADKARPTEGGVTLDQAEAAIRRAQMRLRIAGMRRGAAKKPKTR